MTQEDVLLLIAAGADGPYGLDPVRIMKGAFLASQKGLPEWRESVLLPPVQLRAVRPERVRRA